MAQRSYPCARLALAGLVGAAAWAMPLAAQDAPVPSQMDPAQMEKMLGQMSKMLKEADANEDGKTTRAELDAHRAGMFAKLDRNDDGIVTEADKPKLRIPRKKYSEAYDQIVPKFDQNGDGTLSKAEWNTQERDIFGMLDANGDGAIDASEIPSPPPATQ